MESGSMHSSSSDANGYGYGQMYSGTTTTLGGMTPLPPSPITRLEMTQDPRFNLQNLSPGTAFTLVIYAKNEKVNYILSEIRISILNLYNDLFHSILNIIYMIY